MEVRVGAVCLRVQPEADVRGWRPAGVPQGDTFPAAGAALGGGGELTLAYRRASPGTGRRDQMKLL